MKTTTNYNEEIDQLQKYVLDMFIGIENKPSMMYLRLKIVELLLRKIELDMINEIPKQQFDNVNELIKLLDKRLEVGHIKIEVQK